MRRVLPHPLVSLGLLLMWLLLAGSVSVGSLLLGSVLALGGGAALAALDAPRERMPRLRPLPRLCVDVLIEIVRSNNAVARIILRPRSRDTHKSGFVRIPLDMTSPAGLAALACIVTATPGTVWVDHDPAKRIMLLHVLDLIDEEAWVRIIKDRWERRLMEIFE